MTYTSQIEMKKVHQKEVDAFPIVFAFSNEQFKSGIKKTWGLDYDDDAALKAAHIVSIGAGGYVLKKDIPALKEMFARHKAEEKDFANDFKNLVDLIKAEMNNHEYSYVPYEVEEEIREALSPHQDHPRFEEAWNKAKREVLKAAGYEAYK